MARRVSRSFRYRVRRPAVTTLLIALLILLRFLATDAPGPPVPGSLAEGSHQVERVVDGDTLVLAGGARIRLIGADTPETVKPNHPVEPFGPEATEFTQRFIQEAGGEVVLRMDRERKDRYDRFLAYVYDGERMLNEELICAGLATARTEFYYAESMKRRFRDAEAEAQEAGRGIWRSASP